MPKNVDGVDRTLVSMEMIVFFFLLLHFLVFEATFKFHRNGDSVLLDEHPRFILRSVIRRSSHRSPARLYYDIHGRPSATFIWDSRCLSNGWVPTAVK